MSPRTPPSTVSALTLDLQLAAALEDMPRAANGKFLDLSGIPALPALVRRTGREIAAAKSDDPHVSDQTVLSAALTAQAWRSASFAPNPQAQASPARVCFHPGGQVMGTRKPTRSTSPDSPTNSDASSRPSTIDRPADLGSRRRPSRPLAALAARAADRVIRPVSRSSPVRPQRVVASSRAHHQRRPLGTRIAYHRLSTVITCVL